MIIDLSQYNNVKDWDLVKKYVDGVIFRLGYRGYGAAGNLVLDKKFHAYLSACTSLQVPYGLYFVTQAVTETEAVGEANFIKNYTDILKPTLGIWLDSEWSAHPKQQGRADNISKTLRTKCHNAFIQSMSEFPAKIGIYTGDYWINSKLNYGDLICKNWWLSRYGKNNGQPDKSPTHMHQLWQYTSKGRVPGVVGDVDLSTPVVTKSLPILKGYKGFSITDALTTFGYDSSYSARKKYAELLGISGYKGSEKQNLLMLKMLS